MAEDKRRYNKGTKGNNGGRKPKAEEQKLIEKLTPLEPLAFEQLEKSMKSGQSWAIQMYFNYMYGKPKERIDHTTDGEAMNIPIISFVSSED